VTYKSIYCVLYVTISVMRSYFVKPVFSHPYFLLIGGRKLRSYSCELVKSVRNLQAAVLENTNLNLKSDLIWVFQNLEGDSVTGR